MKARDLAQGKWLSVLSALNIPPGVLDGKHHSCPKDGTGNDRFRFHDRNGSGNYFCACSDGTKGGMSLLMCCRGWTYAEAAKEVEKVAGHAEPSAPRNKPDPLPALQRVQRLARKAGAPVQEYLRNRGLITPPGISTARLSYWADGKRVGEFDAMLGKVVTAAGHPESWHITYLKDGKKAALKPARKVMTPITSVNACAIRLFPTTDHVGIAEGIETAIAAHLLFGVPVWSVMNKNGIRTFIPPAGITRVTVFADNDATCVGQEAAYACAARLIKAGVQTTVIVPSSADTDWNDELLSKTEAA